MSHWTRSAIVWNGTIPPEHWLHWEVNRLKDSFGSIFHWGSLQRFSFDLKAASSKIATQNFYFSFYAMDQSTWLNASKHFLRLFDLISIWHIHSNELVWSIAVNSRVLRRVYQSDRLWMEMTTGFIHVKCYVHQLSIPLTQNWNSFIDGIKIKLLLWIKMIL